MKRVVVVGGGVIGLTSAYSLVRAGMQVTLIEAGATPANGASFANGGQLSYRYVSPLADANVPFKALAWMRHGVQSPLTVRPRLELAQWRWMLSFLRACRRTTNVKNSQLLLELALRSQAVLSQWRAENRLTEFDWRENGKLVLFRQRGSFDCARQAGLDSSQRAMSASECLELEPALHALQGRLCGGVFSPGDEVADCYQFCQALLSQLKASTNFRLQTNCVANGFSSNGNRLTCVHTSQGDIEFDDIVLANGVGGAQLGKAAGHRLLVYPLKGYSLTLALSRPSQAPEVSVTDYDNKVVYARIGENLRVAAMVDIVGNDLSLKPSRLAHLTALAKDTFPKAGDFSNAIQWAGLRPATPTGMPIIGRGQYHNLWFNLGHGALGFTLAAGSSELLAESVQRGSNTLALHAFTPR